MIKVRVLGSPSELDWFRKELMKNDNYFLHNVSRIMKCKGGVMDYRQYYYVTKKDQSDPKQDQYPLIMRKRGIDYERSVKCKGKHR